MKQGLTEFVDEQYDELLNIAEDIYDKSGNAHCSADVVNDTLIYFNSKYSEEWLTSMYEKGELRFFFINAIKRQVTSSKTATYTRYRRFMGNCEEGITLKDDDEITAEAPESADGRIIGEGRNETFLNYLEDRLREVMETKLTTLQLVVFKKYLLFSNQAELAAAARLSTQRISNILKEVAGKINKAVQSVYPDFNCKGRLRSLEPMLRNLVAIQ